MSNTVKPSKAVVNLVFPALCIASLLALLPSGAQAAALVTRSDRCIMLQHQLQTVLLGHIETKQDRQARALQKKGSGFCASKRRAQGLRAYATALNLLGVKPDMTGSVMPESPTSPQKASKSGIGK